MTLDHLPLHQPATVRRVESDTADWPQPLQDLGFAPGERVQVLHRALLGGDPLVVQVGSSRFALRRAEARCVLLDAN